MNTKEYIYCWFSIMVMIFVSLIIVAVGIDSMDAAQTVVNCEETTRQETDEPITHSVSYIKYHDKYFDAALLEETTAKTETKHNESVISDPCYSSSYLGEFILTAYCPCYECCGEYSLNRPKDENGNDIVYGASGRVLCPYYSIAVDPRVIPYGTHVLINGHEYVAADCGGGIKGNRIDIYFANHEETYTIGLQRADVYLLGKE